MIDKDTGRRIIGGEVKRISTKHKESSQLESIKHELRNMGVRGVSTYVTDDNQFRTIITISDLKGDKLQLALSLLAASPFEFLGT